MTLIEAAARLGTSADVLRQAIHRGALKADKHGRDWWVTEAEVERYRRENRRERVAAELRADAAEEQALAEEGTRIGAPVTDD